MNTCEATQEGLRDENIDICPECNRHRVAHLSITALLEIKKNEIKLKALLENSERLLEQVEARLEFRNKLNARFKSIKEVIDLCYRCNYPSNFIVDEYLNPFDSVDASTLYINASESYVSDTSMALNNLQISRVRTEMLQSTESKLEIRLWELERQKHV